jgi:hypothetical protein
MPDGKGEFVWATNAPAGWPAVKCAALPMPHDSPANLARFGESLGRAFGGRPGAFRLSTKGRARLSSYGLLDVPFEVSSDGRTVPVLLYVRADREAGAHFSAARLFLEGRGEPPPVYYAPEKLPEAGPGEPFRPFHAGDLRRWAGKAPPGEYSMWWPASGDESFTGSRAFRHIDRAYRSLSGYETYVHAAVMRALGYEGDTVGRLGLPAEPGTFPLEGPEGALLLLDVSQEKGMRFLFPVERTPRAYRDAFWQVFAGYAEFWNAAASGKGFARDPASGHPPLQWWEEASGAARAEEGRGRRLDGFGTISLGKA